jgi:hypothetical protein
MQIILRFCRILFSPSDMFGLTEQGRNQIISIAEIGDSGMALAEGIACMRYGINGDQFHDLLFSSSFANQINSSVPNPQL